MPARRNKERKGPAASTRATESAQHEESELGDLFEHDGDGYVLIKQVTREVAIRRHMDCRSELIVTKVFHRPGREPGYKPGEIRVIELLAPCNRIVPILAWHETIPRPGFSTAIYPYSEQGDLDNWRQLEFVAKSHKPVPESYIWRFVIQMSQALAFMHGQLQLSASSPNSISKTTGKSAARKKDVCIIHKDIKPKNVLVYYPPSSTYPSFKLHDFGCASLSLPSSSSDIDRYGTYEWQPPENPLINTPAADIWSLGACIHYLCTGRPPIENPSKTMQRVRKQHGNRDPLEVEEYDSPSRYYAARARRVVTPINLDAEEQEEQLRAPFSGNRAAFPEYNAEYSDSLNDCMHRLLAMDAGNRPTGREMMQDVEPRARLLLRQMGNRSALADLDLVVAGRVYSLK